jgi:hypothetical protein
MKDKRMVKVVNTSQMAIYIMVIIPIIYFMEMVHISLIIIISTLAILMEIKKMAKVY